MDWCGLPAAQEAEEVCSASAAAQRYLKGRNGYLLLSTGQSTLFEVSLCHVVMPSEAGTAQTAAGLEADAAEPYLLLAHHFLQYNAAQQHFRSFSTRAEPHPAW